MSSRLLYQDRAVGLSDESLVLRGFTKMFGRPRRIPLNQIVSFRIRNRSDFPNEQLPRWGLDDRGVWYTRDARRWRRQSSVEVTLDDHQQVGFTPAHSGRVRELLIQLGISEE